LAKLKEMKGNQDSDMSKDQYFRRGVSNDGNGGGRRAGARNKLQTKLLEELAADFEEHGAGVIKIARIEKPIEYLKVIASVLPKELIVEQGVLADLSDEEIAAHLSLLQRMQVKAAAERAEPEQETVKH
jgi:hypothetical protein